MRSDTAGDSWGWLRIPKIAALNSRQLFRLQYILLTSYRVRVGNMDHRDCHVNQ